MGYSIVRLLPVSLVIFILKRMCLLREKTRYVGHLIMDRSFIKEVRMLHRCSTNYCRVVVETRHHYYERYAELVTYFTWLFSLMRIVRPIVVQWRRSVRHLVSWRVTSLKSVMRRHASDITAGDTIALFCLLPKTIKPVDPVLQHAAPSLSPVSHLCGVASHVGWGASNCVTSLTVRAYFIGRTVSVYATTDNYRLSATS